MGDDIQAMNIATARLPKSYTDAVRAMRLTLRAHKDALAAMKDGVHIDHVTAMMMVCASTYAAAAQAMAHAESIDECASWPDKTEALAAYARMANDVRLVRGAVRLHRLRMQLLVRAHVLATAAPPK